MANLRVLYLGTGEIGIPSLRFLVESAGVDVVGVVTGPDRPAGRGRRLQAGPVAKFARESNLPLWQPQKLSKEELLPAWSALEPDLLVVMAYGKILPGWVLNLPRIAPWNLHASLLPRHRGASPINAAILAGDSTTGITVMRIDAGLDTGDILCKTSIPIAKDETAGTLHDRMALLAADALGLALQKFRDGNLTPQPQENENATYAPKISKQDGLIDWSQPAEFIERRIRAFTPWPGAQSAIMQEGVPVPLKIGAARISETSPPAGIVPGTVLEGGPSCLSVATGSGALDLLAIQVPGKKMLQAAEFLRGFPIVPGAVLRSS